MFRAWMILGYNKVDEFIGYGMVICTNIDIDPQFKPLPIIQQLWTNVPSTFYPIISHSIGDRKLMDFSERPPIIIYIMNIQAPKCHIQRFTFSQLHFMEFIETIDVSLYYLQYMVFVPIALTKGAKGTMVAYNPPYPILNGFKLWYDLQVPILDSLFDPVNWKCKICTNLPEVESILFHTTWLL